MPESPGMVATARPLRLSHTDLRRLSNEAGRAYPHEACGLLVGRAAPDGSLVHRVTVARNRAVERLRDRYVLEPEDFLRTDRDARRDGLDVIGVWHTHPDHPARPSETDLREAWPDFTYLILSVRRSVVAEVTAWRLVGPRFAPQPIEEVRP